MANKISKPIVDKDIREQVFNLLFNGNTFVDGNEFFKINDRQYGIILTGLDGESHYVRIGAIVAEQREGVTAEEVMQNEIDAYKNKQADKEAKAKAKAEKAKRDKARREAKAEDPNQFLDREVAV